jgi:hypothetical protein
LLTWPQLYDPFGSRLLSAAVSALPVLTLFFVLVVLKRRVWVSALSGLLVAVAVAVSVFEMPAVLVAAAAGHGFIFGMMRIAWIVVSSIFLYNIASTTGQFQVMKDSIAGLSSDKRLQHRLRSAHSRGTWAVERAGAMPSTVSDRTGFLRFRRRRQPDCEHRAAAWGGNPFGLAGVTGLKRRVQRDGEILRRFRADPAGPSAAWWRARDLQVWRR